jgi:hypothetical protein
VNWNHYENCYIPLRIKNDYVRREIRNPTIRGEKFRHNIHIFEQALKNEVNQKPTDGKNLWSLSHIVKKHHEEHREVLPCGCRQMKDCEICYMTMTYENLQSEIMDAAHKIESPLEKLQSAGKNQQKWKTWAKKMQKLTMKNGTKALMLMTAVLIMGNLTKRIPYARGETQANEHFIFKDWGSFVLNPTRMEAIKTINHKQIEARYAQLETLTKQHKALCETNIEKTETKNEDKIRSQFNATFNEFGINDTPRNYKESK